MTLDEISEYIGALHGETQPIGEFKNALMTDALQNDWYWTQGQRELLRFERDIKLLPLAVRALRNQGQPYYDAR